MQFLQSSIVVHGLRYQIHKQDKGKKIEKKKTPRFEMRERSFLGDAN